MLIPTFCRQFADSFCSMPTFRHTSSDMRHISHDNVGCGWLHGALRACSSHTWTWPGLCTQARDRVVGSCVADLVLKVTGMVCQLSHNARGLGSWQARLTRESRQWVWEPHWQESPPGNPSRSRNSRWAG